MDELKNFGSVISFLTVAKMLIEKNSDEKEKREKFADILCNAIRCLAAFTKRQESFDFIEDYDKEVDFP